MTTKEMIEVMQAYERGEQIEYREHQDNFFDKEEWDDGWLDAGEPIWDFVGCDYRIKPQPTYRPYKNAAEFLAAQKEHGLAIRYANSYTYRMILYVDNIAVSVPTINTDGNVVVAELRYKELLNNYTWQDGTPCGVEE